MQINHPLGSIIRKFIAETCGDTYYNRMIIIYERIDGVIKSRPVTARDILHSDIAWVDVFNPTPEEVNFIESRLHVDMPSREQIWKNRVLNRFYEEEGDLYMTAAIITKVESPHPETSAITFILRPNYLLTIRHITPTSFQNFGDRMIQKPQSYPDSYFVLDGLLNEIVMRVAHNSELVVSELDTISHDIFGVNVFEEGKKKQSQSHLMQEVLKRLGTCADLNSKINESLQGVHRLLGFLQQKRGHVQEIDTTMKLMTTDVKALSIQNAFLADKITFLLDATLGMINVEQNIIIKFFSVVAAFFLPPTLISSMYGMNFSDMPELSWNYGYPFAILLMLFCALVPYFYFRRKGWL